MGTKLFAVYILNVNIMLKDLIIPGFQNGKLKSFTELSLAENRCARPVHARTRASSTNELSLLTQVCISESGIEN